MTYWNEDKQADEIIELREEITVLKEMIARLQTHLFNANNRIFHTHSKVRVIITNGKMAYEPNISKVTIEDNGTHIIMCEGYIK